MMETDEKLYVVTGATGFLGNNVVKDLVRNGKRVRCFVRDLDKAKKLFGDLPLEFCTGTLESQEEIEKAFSHAGETIVIHTAARVSIQSGRKNAREMWRVNVEGTRRVVEACLKCGVSRLVYTSSVHAIAEPEDNGAIFETEHFRPEAVHGGYAKSKAGATAIVLDAVKNRGLNAVILHPSGIVGPNDYGATYLTKLVIDYAQGKIPAGVKGGYNFVDVRDVSQGVLAAADSPAASGSCYLLTGHYSGVRDILGELYRQLNGKNIRHMLPMWVAKFACPFLFFYAKVRRIEPLYNSYSLYTLSSNSKFVNDKATRELGFSPRTMADSIADTVSFLRAEGRL